ncbi:MAG TPA: DUF3999 family protein [Vicinamibacteria bacterium]
MRRPCAAAGAAALAATALLAAAPEAPPTFERGIDVRRPGKVVLTLDREVYERARPDLGDLRVVDETGADAPYLLDRVGGDAEPTFREPVAINRVFVRGRSASVTLDLREPMLKSELVLALPGDNFRRRVKVEGRNKHEREWTTITDGAYVFAVPEPVAARYETVHLPQNNQQFLRITVFNGPDDPPRLEILDAWVRPQERRKPREFPFEPRLTRTDDAAERESRLVLDLGARYQPYRAVLLDVADPEFFRGAIVEQRREPLPEAGDGSGALAISWAPVLEPASVYRYSEEGETRESLRLEATGRARVLRVRIRNRDDRPLDVRGATVMVPQERLVFEAVSPHRYRLTYGDAGLEPPAYDVERTVGDAALWIAQASEGRWGPPAVRVRDRPRLPWTERHPALLWAGLVAAVGLLAGVTWRAWQSAT